MPVAHEKRDAEARTEVRIIHEHVEFRQCEAEAVDAGVDMDGAGQGTAIAAAKSSPLAGLVKRDERRPQIIAGIEFGLSGKESVEHVDDRLWQEGPQVFAFLGARHEIVAAAGVPQGTRHGLKAEAIGVALHRRAAGGLASLLAERAVIVLQGSEVNREHGAGKIGRNGIGHHGAPPLRQGWTCCNR